MGCLALAALGLCTRRHLGDLKGDGRLTDPVVLQRQLVQQALGVLVGRVHGGHTGVLLAAEAVDQGAVDKARNIALDHIVQHRDHVRHKLKGVGGMVLFGGGKVCPVEGQQTGALGRRGEAAGHIGVDNIDLFPLAGVEAVQQDRADLPGALQGGILRRVEEALLDGNMVLIEIVPSVLTDHEQLGAGMVSQDPHGLLDGVLVVGAGQTLVGRDDQAGVGSALDVVLVGRVEVPAADVAGGAENPLDLTPQGFKVRAGVGQVLPGAAQLGGGDQIHGVGDLLGLADAFDPVLDLFGARHLTAPSSGTRPRRCGPGR